MSLLREVDTTRARHPVHLGWALWGSPVGTSMRHVLS
jgi:hypothetical protein